MKNPKFTPHLRENQHRLVIFGSGFYGTGIAKSCAVNEITPACFCDNNVERIGCKVEDIPVKSLADVVSEIQNPIFIISPYEAVHIEEILKQLDNLNIEYMEYYMMRYFFRYIDEVYIESVFETQSLYGFRMGDHYTLESPYLCVDWIELNITPRCTLRCEACSNLMNFYDKPQHHKTEDILASLDQLDATFDGIHKIHILGGEPMLHPDVFDIIAYAQTKSAIKSVVMVTNGTILPKKEDLQKIDRKKTLIRISNYGELSTKKDEFVAILEELDLPYLLEDIDIWHDAAAIMYRNKTVKELEKMFEECCTPFTEVVDGKLFWCPFLAAIYRLQGAPKEDIEYIDLLDSSKTADEKKMAIKQYKYGMAYFKGCNWCIGRTRRELIDVAPAIQNRDQIPYEKFDWK